MFNTVLIRQAFKLSLSLVLFYWLALWMDWDMPKYGALAIVLISLGTTGASLQKGMLRIVGTTAGLAVGLFGLALCAQDRWLTLVALSVYLTVVSYFMPTSRYSYAWFVAGFLPPLVWATTYGKVDNAFSYAVFRYLETSSGVIIYTVVSTLLWPKQAGTTLDREGRTVWTDIENLFGLYLRQLDEGTLPPEAPPLRAKASGESAQMMTTLEAAYADTPSVRDQKRVWERLRVNLRTFADAMELWRESLEDCRRLHLATLLPGLRPELDVVDQRLRRVSALWDARASGADPVDADDGDRQVLEPLSCRIDPDGGKALAHFDRAALLGFSQQLEILDVTSRELLRTMRVLAGLDPAHGLGSSPLPSDLYEPSAWDPVRLLTAVFPALCFAVAFLFWIVFDPPTGPSVPSFAATIGLLVVMTPMNAMSLLMPMLVIIWVAVAPVYFLVMPRLHNGPALLTLVFVYAFAASLVCGRLAPYKSLLLILFVMMVNITNEQKYSFQGLIDGALMLLTAIGIIGIVQMLLTPLRPERVMLRDTSRFFRGCSRITSEFVGRRPKELRRGRTLRARYYRSMVMPVPRAMSAVSKKLDYGLFPENTPEKVQHLIDALQTIAFRFQTLEISHGRLARHAADWPDPMFDLGRQLRERLQQLFIHWSRFEPALALNEANAMGNVARRIEEQLEATLTDGAGQHADDQTLTDLYALLGSARGLIRAIAETHGAVAEINWDQWAEARF